MNIKDIKFKAQRYDGFDMVEGDLYTEQLVFCFEPSKILYYIVCNVGPGDWGLPNNSVLVRVKPETIKCDYIDNIEKELIARNNQIEKLLTDLEQLNFDYVNLNNKLGKE